MEAAIDGIEAALRTLKRDPWSQDFKVSDDFLPLVFERYFASLGLENRMMKTNFHVLADYMELGEIDPEIVECLDALVTATKGSSPTG